MSETNSKPEKTEAQIEAEIIASGSNNDGLDGPLKYPISEMHRYGARVSFIPKLVTGPKIEGDFSLGDIFRVAGKALLSPKTAKDYKKKADKESKKTDKPSNSDPDTMTVKKGLNKPLPEKKIQIYLPVSFNTTDTLNYDSPSIGTSGALLESGLNNSAGGSGTDILGGAVTDFIDLFKGSTNGGALGKLGVAKLAGRGPAEIAGGASSSLRVTVDPNVRTLFRGVAVRQFSFQFKFIAKNSREAKEVKSIIKRLRFYSYPESIQFGGESGESISVGFKYPHPFEIRAAYVSEKGVETRIGPLMKDCYLTNIQTNYNPSSMSFHSDGEPVEIDLSLSFTEQTTLHKSDIVKGF